jgi:hypothetical protein
MVAWHGLCMTAGASEQIKSNLGTFQSRSLAQATALSVGNARILCMFSSTWRIGVPLAANVVVCRTPRDESHYGPQ